MQTEVFRFYGGPIDDDDGPEIFINSWPIDEAYIDYVEGIPFSGMINDPKAVPEITTELLEVANERGGETMISCGYHAIEFLLWGQDFNDHGPGNRPVSDYTTAKYAKRRAEYINACCDLLIRNLQSLVNDWAVNDDANYRANFLSDPGKAVWNILAGVKHLSGTELAGERLLVAWDTQAQEDEHSCFSDTTNQDVILDVQGMVNVYRGSYRRVEGTTVSGAGMDQIVAFLNPTVGEDLEKLVPQCLTLAREIPAPFDTAILGDRENAPGRKAIFRCVIALEDQAALWGKVEQELIKKVRNR